VKCHVPFVAFHVPVILKEREPPRFLISMDNTYRNHLASFLKETRRAFHRHPELAYEERWTTNRIVEILASLGIQARTFGTLTGATALVGGKAQDGCLALRADIDALPIQEETKHSFVSLNPGQMHACGHDGHIAILLGTAKYLVDSGMAEQLPGHVKLIFQPAEEGGAGAKRLIEEVRILEDPPVDWILGCHVSNYQDINTIGIYRKQCHAAAESFTLRIHGTSCHAARPQMGCDPIAAAGHFITLIQSGVARRISPKSAGVVTIGAIHGGIQANIIPDLLEMKGTVRSEDKEVRQALHDHILAAKTAIEGLFGVTCQLTYDMGYPPNINDPTVIGMVEEQARALPSVVDVIELRPETGGEDFAFYSQLKPSGYFKVGTRNEERGYIHPGHSSKFDFDEDGLIVGVEMFISCIREFMKRHAS